MTIDKVIDILTKFKEDQEENNNGHFNDGVLSVTVEFVDYMQVIIKDKKLILKEGNSCEI